jgi:hypothetical protein
MSYHVTKKVFEVIEMAAEANTKVQKIEILKTNETQALKDVLLGTYDDYIEWNLPDGKPPYEPADPKTVPSNLLKRTKQFNNLVKGGPGDKLPAFKREMIFIRLIESIHPNDAELLLKMVVKKQLGKGITKKLVEEAFPGLIRIKPPT